MRTLTPTWGQSLLIAVHESGTGMRPIADAIKKASPSNGASSTTLGKLYDFDNPSEMDDRYLRRAWLVLTAIGEDPTEWGISDELGPEVDHDRVRNLLQRNLYAPRDLNPEPTD